MGVPPPNQVRHRAKRVATFEIYRRKYLPSQIEATRRKLASLLREAERYGMTDLLDPASE